MALYYVFFAIGGIALIVYLVLAFFFDLPVPMAFKAACLVWPTLQINSRKAYDRVTGR